MAAPIRRFPRVVLLGGAPLSGKGSVARILAARLGYDLVCTDDLGAAARALTAPAVSPALHPMAGIDYRDYYLRRSVEDLWRDAQQAHHALWPAIDAVIRSHREWGHPAVVEGWAILPELARRTTGPDVFACWLLLEPDVLAERLRRDTPFLHGAAEPEPLVAAFTERSRRYNEHITHPGEHLVLRIEPTMTPEAICGRILKLAIRPPTTDRT